MERKRSKKPKASTSVKKKRSAGRRTKVEKDVAEQVPKPFKVADIIDVPTEAQNFNVALERAEEIAKESSTSENGSRRLSRTNWLSGTFAAGRVVLKSSAWIS
jgi:hypothetical protein